MNVREITENKRDFNALLLLGDEQQSMIDRYIDDGRMFALDDGGVKAVCVVIGAGEGVLEIKNLSVATDFQRKGYGKAMIDFLAKKFQGQYGVLQVGTGESPLTLPFYENCGFVRSHTVADFFTEHYDHPIIEGGVKLVDMIYLRKEI